MSELMSQVLYLDSNSRKERLSGPEPESEARRRAEKMAADGIEVLAIMDADKAEAYLNNMVRIKDRSSLPGKFQPLEQEAREKISRDVVQELTKREANDAHLRRTAVDFALRLYQQANQTGFVGTAEELVKDSKIILDFLKG